tara:strand:- start:386 stop:664 length:279 start_codon:yes stop_codon:yes gene_type:complete
MKIIIALLLVSLSPMMDAKTKDSISNASGSGMPIAKSQRVGDKHIHTAKAKKGFCFAVKGKRIIYMTEEMADKHEATKFSMSHEARKFAKSN